MDQILPVEDEDGETEVHIISSSFSDPYLLILCDDSSVKLFQATDSGEIEEVECNAISSAKWLSASLFQPSFGSEVYAFLLTPEGGLQVSYCCGMMPGVSLMNLQIFSLLQLEEASYSAAGLGFLPPLLTEDFSARRATGKAAITEILAAELGDATSKSPHLIVRTFVVPFIFTLTSLQGAYLHR